MSAVSLELVRAGMAPYWRAMAESCGGSIWAAEGVLATIIPTAPDRSVFNSVLYERPEPLLEGLPELAAAYERAGIRAWTVWVPERDEVAAAGLEEAGHHLDAAPRAMAMSTAELRDPEPDPELEIERSDDLAELARLNEFAYGYEPGGFAPLADSDLPSFHLYFGHLDGERAAAAGIWDHRSDGVLSWVATVPEARGRGASKRLCARAIADARERGIVTTTLQATKLGRPVYEALGYRDFGALQMWERRSPRPS